MFEFRKEVFVRLLCYLLGLKEVYMSGGWSVFMYNLKVELVVGGNWFDFR